MYSQKFPPYIEDGDLVMESVRRHTGSVNTEAPTVWCELYYVKYKLARPQKAFCDMNVLLQNI